MVSVPSAFSLCAVVPENPSHQWKGAQEMRRKAFHLRDWGLTVTYSALEAKGMSIYAVLTPATVCRALREAGFPHPAEALHIDAREERWAVSLPDGHIAWFPASEAGVTRLAVERRVLGLLATRCSFRVPEILFVSNSGFDVRRMVPGRCDPWGLYRRCQDDPRFAQKIGHAIGQIFVEQHTRIVEADAVGWLRQQVPWPETGAWIGERLPRVIDDRGLIRALADVIE